MTNANILTTDDQIRTLLQQTKRIAVLGIKTEAQADQPSFTVPKYLQSVGFDVIPVPVYYPEVATILGRPVFRTLAAIEGDVDLVDVFRKSSDVKKHVADILAKKPRAVWLQLGIRDDAVAEELAQAGIQVVQDKCILVEHRRLL
ncbi:MAG: CoA-binding protein [Polyangiaceae bacterium]